MAGQVGAGCRVRVWEFSGCKVSIAVVEQLQAHSQPMQHALNRAGQCQLVAWEAVVGLYSCAAPPFKSPAGTTLSKLKTIYVHVHSATEINSSFALLFLAAATWGMASWPAVQLC